MQSKLRNVLGLAGLGLMLSAGSALAGDKLWDFATDPANDPLFEMYGNNDIPWMNSSGNPGGFLALTYSMGSQNKWVLFPDIDNGKTVTAFTFDADLRVGNPQSDRAADGFSINFARASDPLLANPSDINQFATAGCPETGTASGIAICFDTWSGNTLPDGADIEGIIVRVDNVTVLRYAMPTRNGAADDATSMQTGPRDAAYWSDPGYAADNAAWAHDPNAWKGLAWKHLTVVLDNNAKLTVTWKGVKILDAYQTAFFPSPGRIVMACRTGGSNENTHMDNIHLVTTAIDVDTQAPTVPGAVVAGQIGAGRLALHWPAATDNSGRVGYELEKDGTVLTATIVDTNYVDAAVTPKSTHTYRVRAYDVSGNKSAFSPLFTVTTVDEVASIGILKAEIWDGISGTAVQALLDDANYQANKPSRSSYIFGMDSGNANGLSGWNNAWGDNYGMRITGTLIPAETAQYDFFIRSDDASQFYLNTSGAALPVPGTDTALIEETGCCKAFLEPNNATEASVTTASPIALTAGKAYGFVILLKEGGGGDGVAVGLRKVGDLTPAANLPSITGALVAGKQDAVGASVNISRNPQSVTVIANEKTVFSAAATVTSPYSTSMGYQWYKNGTVIPGATAATYSIPVASLADNGAKFKVLVIGVGAQLESSEATLTVLADTKLPTLLAVESDDSFTKLKLTFSEPVKAPSATTAANYALDNGATVSAAALVDAFTVRLTTSKLTENTLYTLTVNNVQDNAGNAIAANTKFKFQSYVLTKGVLKWSVWTGIGGTVVTDLTGNAAYAGPANVVQFLSAYESPVDWSDNFGAEITGYITPEKSGDYVFFVNSDDASELYLSTDDSAANLKLIAQETGWSGSRTWVGVGGGSTAADKRSDSFGGTQWPTANISLVAGRKYYTRLIQKEGGGGDEGQATWKLASDPDPANGDASKLTGNLIAAYTPLPATNVLAVGDTIVASSTNSPSAEIAPNVLDGKSSTKYLNFDKLNTGFTVTPKSGATVITGITLTTANDAPERDPATYTIQGSLDGQTFTTIATGSVPAVTTRFFSRTYTFANIMPYTIYKVIFPTVANATKANSMQIADVALLGNAFGGTLAAPVEAAKFTSIVKNADGTFTITWTGGGTLQASPTVNGPYTDVPGATSPYKVTPVGSSLFGRIRQ